MVTIIVLFGPQQRAAGTSRDRSAAPTPGRFPAMDGGKGLWSPGVGGLAKRPGVSVS